ncbi:hypothetical protein [Gimesia chilikensis]|uniref:hypothetical protein n=1 Tax=Gimesia chilikensis TaxID=2605989 RepID=UPI003A942C54
MSWIKMNGSLKDEEEVFGIHKKTGLSIPAVIGSLQIIWSWADERTDNGFVRYHDASDIDAKVDHKGFANAMRDVGWLEFRDGGVQFPNFEVHMSKSAKKRAADAKRKGKTRNTSGQKSHPEADKSRFETGQKSDQRREEKRREEVKEKEKKETQSGDCSPSPDSRIPNVEQLDALVDAFELLPEGIGHPIRDRRGKTLLKGWRRVQKDPETRQAFEDIPALMARIRDGTFLHGQGFWNFSWLFAKGRDGQWNVLKILEGRYVEGKSKQQHRDPARIAGRPASLKYFEKPSQTETRPG